MSDLVRQHVRKLLEAPFLAEQARRRRAHELDRAGHRVVQDSWTSATGWVLRDWLTGEVIAAGDDGPTGLRAVTAGTWSADDLYAEIPGPDWTTPGIPPSLSEALEEWLFAASTADEEIAEFVGWPVGKVREHR